MTFFNSRFISAALKAPAVSRFLSPGDLDPATMLPPPPKDDAPDAVEGRAELHRIAAARTPERLEQAKHDDEVEDVRSIADVPPNPSVSRRAGLVGRYRGLASG